MNRSTIIVMLLVIWSVLSVSAEDGISKTVKGREGSEIHLSKKLHRILSAEMNAIQNATTNLAVAIPAGKWNSIVETAQKMKKGYVIKQRLSSEELKEFYRSLPTGYKNIDHEFQNSLNDIIQSAQKHNVESTNLLFYKLFESCVKCHSEYAKKRFPGFK